MSNMVTRCPQCQTSFKVTEEHLKIANGAVRCGSCLLVFQARQHWVNPENMAAAPAPAAGGKFRFDQSAIDNPVAGSPASSGTAPASGAVLPSTPFVLPKVTTETAKPAAEQHTHKKLEEIGDDDRISDDLDIEDDEPAIVPKKPAASTSAFGEPDDDYASVFDDFDGQAESENFDQLLEEDFNDLDALLDDDAQANKTAAPSDEAWAKDMLAEIEQDEKPAPLNLNEVEDAREIFKDFSNPVDVDAARRDLGFDRPDPFAAKDLGEKRGDSTGARAEMIAHIEPLPVEMSSGQAEQTVDWKSIVLLNTAAVVLLLLLLVQYVGFNFSSLAKSNTTRPYMQALCGVVGCALPAVENWRYVKIQNLVVRKHPQAEDGLAVDAILLNVTGHELPFPQLELYFSDLAKTPVASRRFSPAEYLSGELSGQTQIPPGRPVHIALEIVNPGEDAVNWTLQVAGKTD